MRNKSISVVLPAYNEQDNIEEAVESIYEYLTHEFSDFEIIVVDDGSSDDTAKKVKALQKKKPYIHLIRHEENRGYGSALRSGFTKATKDFVFYTDADNQFNIVDLQSLLPLSQQYDIISAYRKKRNDPFMRLVTAYVYNVLIKTLFGLRVRDIDASFKLYKRQVLKDMQLKSQTGLIDAEVLIKAQKKGFSIGQVGVSHYPRKKGKTMYEVKNGFASLALVRPQVVIDIFKEIHSLWGELR
ncbi:MAG TPA: glycosyltransferase family 2 protein [Patescibacteria group bacterium]|nr:glycosyltransferase family 2 protein [Patescibacteria group bacterium]